MVGSTFNRSPSPMSSRPNPNPNSRSINQESEGIGARKSFSGYPFANSSLISQQRGLIPNTPVNSPAEYSRKSSFGRECGGPTFRDHELKENTERDPNIKPAARAKSPSLVTKGSKNFMAPTISAASKINPSPRKKVLGESPRNDCIRASASLSDGKFHFFSTSFLESEPTSDMDLPPCPATRVVDKADNEIHSTQAEKFAYGSRFGDEKMEAFQADLVVLSPEIPLYSSRPSEPLPLSEMPKMVVSEKVGLGVNVTTCCSPYTTVPLEADPSLPPYDPKTNYLSPRPQFLHYNPNRKIESYGNQGIRLEDDFTSESVTETENSSEEVQSKDSQKDQDDAASSVGISFEENSSSSETIPTESEQLEEKTEAKLKPKPRWFTPWKTIVVLMLILLGSLSVAMTFYPGFENAVRRDKIISQIFSEPHAVAELARDSLNGLIENAVLWPAHSADYLSQMIQTLREVDRSSPVTYFNFTNLKEDDWNYAALNLELGPQLERTGHGRQTISDPTEDFAEMQSYPESADDEAFTDMQSKSEPDYNDTAAEEPEIGADESSEALAGMQSYPEPEENETPAEDASLISLEDAVDESREADESSEALAGMQSYPEPENEPEGNVTPAKDASLISLEDAVDESGKVEETSVGHDTVISVEDALMQNQDPAAMTGQATTVHEIVNLVDTAEYDLSTCVTVEDESQPKVVDEPQSDNVEGIPEAQSHTTENEFSTEADLSTLDDFQTEMINLVSGSSAPKATEGDSQLQEAIETNLDPITAAISLVIVSLLAAAAFLYTKPKKDAPPIADQFVAKEKPRYTHVASNMEPSRHETVSSWSGPTEVDMIGESCPSEMSSFQTSTDTKKKQKGVDEAQSLQKGSKRSVKRESLAGSSDYTATSSYGSFTTYSIMHPKHGDDEVVTPVRRSNRIRSKVTSP